MKCPSVVLVLALLTSPVMLAQEAVGRPADASVLTDALAHLDALASRKLTIEQTLSGFRVEGTASHAIDAGSPMKPYLAIAAAGRAQGYQERKVAAWDAGRVAAIDFPPRRAGEEPSRLPDRVFYWGTNRGIDINVVEGAARILATYKGFDDYYWPQDLQGYIDATPLAFVVRYAQSAGTLEVLDSSDTGFVIRFPLNTSFSEAVFEGVREEQIPHVTLTFERQPTLRIRRWEMGAKGREYVQAFRVLRWDRDEEGMLFGTEFDYEFNLKGWFDDDPKEDRRIVFRVMHKLAPDTGLDGQAVADLVHAIGFLDTGVRYLASKRGVDYVVQGVVAEFRADAPGGGSTFSPELRAEVTRSFESSMQSHLDRVRASGRAWPELTDQFIRTKIVGGMEQFDLSKKYCSQVAISVLRRMHGQDARFVDALAKNSSHRMMMSQVVDTLRDFGLHYQVVRGGNPADFVGSAPFAALIGEDPIRAHMAVAQRRADGRFAVWSPPDSARVVRAEKLEKISSLGVFLVPAEDVPVEGFWSRRRLGFGLLGIGLLGAIWMWSRRRSLLRLAQAAACAMLALSIAACGDVNAADAASGNALVAPATTLPLFRIALGAVQERELEIQNLTDEPVRLHLTTASCSCVSAMGRTKQVVIPPRGTEPLTVRVSGDSVGNRRETLYFTAVQGERTTTLKVPVKILVGTAMVVSPAAVRIAGKGGQKVSAAFKLSVACARGDEIDDLRWDSPDLSITRQEETEREVGPLAVTHLLTFDCVLPEVAPGPRMATVRFRNPKPSGGEDTLDLHVALMITK